LVFAVDRELKQKEPSEEQFVKESPTVAHARLPDSSALFPRLHWLRPLRQL